MRKQHVELEELDREFNDGGMNVHVYREKREALLTKIAREPAPPAPPPAPKKDAVSPTTLRLAVKVVGRVVREVVKQPLEAKLSELQSKLTAAEARIKLLEARPLPKSEETHPGLDEWEERRKDRLQ